MRCLILVIGSVHSGLEMVADYVYIENLLPFTRWVTPKHMPRRYSTQMYLYFLPLSAGVSVPTGPSAGPSSGENEYTLPMPTSDGGIEHTAARFLHPDAWLSLARSGSIVLFPPQYFLLHLLSSFLAPTKQSNTNDTSLVKRKQRDDLLRFVHAADPPWTERFFSPYTFPVKMPDGRSVFVLDKPIPELAQLGRKGDEERVLLIRFMKEGPRDLEVRWKEDVLRELRETSML